MRWDKNLQLCPDGASIKRKMVYASSAAAIKATLGTGKMLQFQVFMFFFGASYFFQSQVSEESDLSHKEMYTKVHDKYLN